MVIIKIINIKNNDTFLKEYVKLCSLEWGSDKNKYKTKKFINDKIMSIKSGDKVISILGLVNEEKLIGFISLFKYDGEERKDLSPWYATMYVKKEYRGKNYSKLLNDAILLEAKKLGYDKLYLKTNLNNYYEKFGAKYIETLKNGEKLYDIKC